MSSPITIVTKKKEIVFPEGTIYFSPFGAGTELRLSRVRRRMLLCEQKIADKTATDETYDSYDNFEEELYDIIKNSLTDNCDGELVKSFVESTPLNDIVAYIEGRIEPNAEKTD